MPVRSKPVSHRNAEDSVDSDVFWEIQENTPSPGFSGWFIRGDANYNGKVDIADAITILRGLFDKPEVILCREAADTNNSGMIDLSDAIYLLDYLFIGNVNELSYPHQRPGEVPASESLGCAAAE